LRLYGFALKNAEHDFLNQSDRLAQFEKPIGWQGPGCYARVDSFLSFGNRDSTSKHGDFTVLLLGKPILPFGDQTQQWEIP
jgi:hypothetical protein